MAAIDWNLVAVWAQAIASTVVLVFIYKQIRQGNTQIKQNDQHELYRRSWDFLRFYREELHDDDVSLSDSKDDFDPMDCDMNSDLFREYMKHFYRPRLPLFVLLNQLIEHEAVDERLLFGYLRAEFNRFVQLGVRHYGAEEFRRQCGELKLLLTLWGSQISAGKLLFGATQENVKRASA